MSQSQPSGVPGRGVMRFLSGGKGSSRFAGVFQFADAIFSPSKSAAYVAREEQRRRKVAVPAPGEPPDAEPDADDATAIPTGLLGAVLTVEPGDHPGEEPGAGPAEGGGRTSPAGSAQGEQPASAVDEGL